MPKLHKVWRWYFKVNGISTAFFHGMICIGDCVANEFIKEHAIRSACTNQIVYGQLSDAQEIIAGSIPVAFGTYFPQYLSPPRNIQALPCQYWKSVNEFL